MLYKKHKKKQAIKLQAITTPDGLFHHLHGPEIGHTHDMYMYALSGVDNRFAHILETYGKQYIVFGDSGYSWRVFLKIPFTGASLAATQRAFSKAMVKVRITALRSVMQLKRLWRLTGVNRKMRLGEMPAELIYRAVVVLTNLQNCISPNIISQFF